MKLASNLLLVIEAGLWMFGDATDTNSGHLRVVEHTYHRSRVARDLKPKGNSNEVKKARPKKMTKLRNSSQKEELPTGIEKVFFQPFQDDPLLFEFTTSDGFITSINGDKTDESFTVTHATIQSVDGTKFGTVAYDELLRPLEIATPDGALIRFTYDDSAGRVSVNYLSPDGTVQALQAFDTSSFFLNNSDPDNTGGRHRELKRPQEIGPAKPKAQQYWVQAPEKPFGSRTYGLVWQRCGEVYDNADDYFLTNTHLSVTLYGGLITPKTKYYSFVGKNGYFSATFPVLQHDATTDALKTVCKPTADFLNSVCTVTGSFDGFYQGCLGLAVAGPIGPEAIAACELATLIGGLACKFFGTSKNNPFGAGTSFAQKLCGWAGPPEGPFVASEADVGIAGRPATWKVFDPRVTEHLDPVHYEDPEQDSPSLHGLWAEPWDPYPWEDIVVYADYGCVDDFVMITVVGTDGYYKETTCFDKPNGVCPLYIEGAADGVIDTITVWYDTTSVGIKQKRTFTVTYSY